MNINHVLSQQINPSFSTIDSTVVQYDPTTINAVWDKAQKVYGFYFFKRDSFGEIIAKHDFEKKTQYGWKIVRMYPVLKEELMKLTIYNQYIGKTYNRKENNNIFDN